MRLAELIGTLSLATDAGTGMPDHHALRGAVVAARFAQVLGADARTVADAYYLPLLAASGCTAESYTSAEVFGDEIQSVSTPTGSITEARPRCCRRCSAR